MTLSSKLCKFQIYLIISQFKVLGMDGYIAKPIDVKSLVSTIMNILNGQ